MRSLHLASSAPRGPALPRGVRWYSASHGWVRCPVIGARPLGASVLGRCTVSVARRSCSTTGAPNGGRCGAPSVPRDWSEDCAPPAAPLPPPAPAAPSSDAAVSAADPLMESRTLPYATRDAEGADEGGDEGDARPVPTSLDDMAEAMAVAARQRLAAAEPGDWMFGRAMSSEEMERLPWSRRVLRAAVGLGSQHGAYAECTTRSSAYLLEHASASDRSPVDSAEAVAGELSQACGHWQQYAPTERELAAAIADDDGGGEAPAESGGEEGGGEEDDKEETDVGECARFWWQAPRLPSQQPLLVPDKDGAVATPALGAGEQVNGSSQRLHSIEKRMIGHDSYLARQDSTYLAAQTPPELRATHCPPPLAGHAEVQGGKVRESQCVLVVFAANDLRVHDNYALALAAARAHAAGGLPVVAVCVLDYRTFAQPSVVGGFFRQGPLRARYLLDTVAALRRKLEGDAYRVPLLVRVGRPEEHVPRLAVELGAVDVYVTSQYAPHERRVHDRMLDRLRRGEWLSREELLSDGPSTDYLVRLVAHPPCGPAGAADAEPQQHFTERHPYADRLRTGERRATAVHSVWQTTLVHLDDLPTPIAAMKDGERWYHDDVTTATIRPTLPYTRQTQRLRELPCWAELLPSPQELAGTSPPTAIRGVLPSLYELGYADESHSADLARLLAPEEVMATQSSHFAAGEDAAVERVQEWLAQDGLTSMLRLGREGRTNTKMYSQRLARVSPYLAVGALSPRMFYELFRRHALDRQRDGFAQAQYREALLRLSRRDYWHWAGLRYGDRLFFSYGPRPQLTDAVPDWRRDAKLVHKWCLGLNGIPFADAAMRELLTTGFVASEGRQALIWLLSRGYGQDWRLGAEWLERCALDYDPFICYGNSAFYSDLLPDDFGETVRSVHYLAHHHDQTGIYVKKWLPQLSKLPPVYVHRPHVLTPRMQAMHGVYLGANYPYPLKLWDGAQHTLSGAQLPAYFAGDALTAAATPGAREASARLSMGYAEAVRCGTALLQPEELSCAVHAPYIVSRPWAHAFLPADAVSARDDAEEMVAPRRSNKQHAAHSRAFAKRAVPYEGL